MRYELILAEALSTVWSITLEYRAIIASVLARRIAGHREIDPVAADQIAAGQLRAATRGGGARVGAIAVMPILGALMPRSEALEETSGAISTQERLARFDALMADESIAGVVLDIDSPGGSVGGIAEFADRVYDARATKPVVAIANTTMASAAYWIGSAAAELVASPSSMVGSIGVYTLHQDISEALAKEGIKVEAISYGANKLLGNPFAPLSDDARAELQKRVDGFGEMFTKAVARGRGVSQKTVREDFGQGLVFGAEESVKRGLADRVGTIDDAIALAAKKAGVKTSSRAESAAPTLTSEAIDYRLTLAEKGL